ncbi:hypothetical protein I0C86_37465 [Plantactinospora sp. S1510]|uniref:Uncharacterized protein n=1 Tax=Plantactinospora alkalitolerans TaxID=2789879 RepID=A0ABS0H7X6_9ACTN|nr:hypothetical protein [Plantactinospora alkalitolerans]MBF9134578.1 hypothetical protein [Plantactinospora alkalitolerans]
MDDGERALVIDGELHDLLVMLASSRDETVAETAARLIEAEFDRINPGMLDDIRRPGAAIKRLYAATGRPIPEVFRESVEPEFGRAAGVREIDDTSEFHRV